MGAFIAAYLVIWLAVAVYVTVLGVRQHRLAKDIGELQAELAQQERLAKATSKAA